jgi:hypothetical protein
VPDDRFADFYRVKFRAVARIDGTEVPISSFDVRYKGDSIPHARIEMPMGVNAFNQTRSAAEGVIANIKPFSTLEIWIETTFQDGRAVAPDNPAGPGLNQGKTRIFDGYVHAPNYQRANSLTGGGQGLSLTGFGKTGGLAGSTQLVQGTIVPEPSAGVGLVNAQAGAGSVIVPSLKDSLLNQPLEKNLWIAGIQPLMQAAINTLAAFKDYTDDNKFADEAFKRINVHNVIPETLLDLTDLTGEDVDGGAFRTALSGAMADTFYNSWAARQRTGTLWDALRNLGGLFYFHIIPVVEEDGLVPLCFNFGGKEWREILPSDYSTWQQPPIGFDAGLYTYVTRIALKSDKFSMGEFQDKAAKTTSLGTAEIKKELLGGMGQLRMAEAPAWSIPTEASGANSLRPGKELPDAANPSADGGTDNQGGKEQALLSSDLGKGLAKLILHDNLFFHRRAGLAGRFRLDIAPGSLLKIHVPGAAGGDILYAVVLETNLRGGTKGQASYAGTSFSLTAVRSEKEHTTISQPEVQVHPLYTSQAFRGCPLVTLE